MASKKPHPLYDHPARVRCPVCNEISYSSAGIHPQCAVRREDNERMRHVRLRKIDDEAKVAAAPNDMSPWKRICPACNAAQHVRMKACSCGHVFSLIPRPSTIEEDS
ncbi:MAG TPA: hypothetical protein PLY87_12520 [Planctomycetaceae bacterium]|nr:hypothetical protein [Planctomycetaceae bacterium]HQZ65901.1 hypothetical protein [Planctomycetaceae bacterium]HRA87286.1 hypothetical protein [Planctomycetaceae bacterium]